MSAVLLWVAVALVGGTGAVVRFLVDRAVTARVGGAFPTGILVVNVSGALVLGVLAGAALPHDASLLAATAFVGAYTTFSTWMLDVVEAAGRRALGVAVANVLVSLALGLAAAALGRQVGLGL